MSNYPNVTQKDVIELAKVSKQTRNQGAIELKSNISEQNYDKQLAEIS